MLCSKCHENIPQGEEMQVKGTIICKECISFIEKENREKAVARCWNCNEFILKGDLIHEISKNNSKNWINWLFFWFRKLWKNASVRWLLSRVEEQS